MKVLLVTAQVIEDTGNTYRCTANLYEIVKRFSYLGELYIYSAKYNGRNSHTKIEKDLDGIVQYGNISFFKSSRLGFLRLSEYNRKAISEIAKTCDLLISYGSSYDIYKIARKYNKKFMSFVVSCAWDAYWNHGWQGKILAPYKFFRARYTIRYSDYVLYVSNKFLQNRYPTDAKYQAGCSNVKILPMDDETLTNRIAFLEQWDGKTLNLATTAAVDVLYKGQQYVIKAMYELKKQGITNVHYYLLGGGSQDRLRRLVNKLGLSEQVHFMGIVPHKEVFDVLDRMHLYVQPSLQEGLPRSMVEAMSRGLMCAGANTAAIPELIDSKYVTRRRSVDDFVNIIKNITKEDLIQQAKINFAEAKNYQDEVISKRRNEFFDKIIKDCELA
jgi:glycosyltransferase involved in cell wall biosynthesis